MAEPVGLVQTRCDLVLDGERQIESQRRNGIDQQIADSRVDAGSHNALTKRIAEKPASPDTDVVGDHAILAGIVVDIHAAAT